MAKKGATTQPQMPEIDGLEVRHSDVHARGIRFHVAEAGEGPPIVLLHGWPQCWFAWRKVLPALAAEHRVICPDLRGMGWSDAPPAGYDKRDMADDVIAVLDELGLDRVSLVAHDWGGWIGFLIAIGHPERFSSYLALNIPTPWSEPPTLAALPALARLWYQAALGSPGGGALIRRTPFVRKLITAGAVQPEPFTEEELDLYEQILRVPDRTRASVLLYRTFLRHEAPAFARDRYLGERTRLEVPTLMLFGTHDIAIDHKRLGPWEENSNEMELELREDSGHFIGEEIPDVVADRALGLAAGLAPAEVKGRT